MPKQMYTFYIKGDINQEAISLVSCDDKEEAIEIFCNQKQLTRDDFLELFEVSNENGNNQEDI
tara:strand:- start:176 stop:364 length:189 start_codon:yes stop_codon:yes gene_type:complete